MERQLFCSLYYQGKRYDKYTFFERCGDTMSQQKKDRMRISAIFLAGCLLRLFYVLQSTIFQRQYDIGNIDLSVDHTVSGGHLAYIQYLYQQGHMPDFDPTLVYQFHHPPLHHLLSALVLKLFAPFIKDNSSLYETLQIIPFLCSIAILWYGYKIMKRLSGNRKALELGLLILAFHPALVLLSGSVNNDALSLLFMLLCIEYTWAWSESHSLKDILKAALAVSLGIMTKQSVALMAFPMAIVFIYEWIKEAKRTGKKTSFLFQYAVFLVVSLPIGLWFYIRNLVLFHVPIVWVYELPTDSWQYTGNIPVVNRFLWPDIREFVDGLRHFQLGCGYNIWIQIMRTSVLGEWDMAEVSRGIKLLAMLLMVVGFALAAVVLACDLLTLLRRKRYQVKVPPMILLVGTYVVQFFAYFKFYYEYPQECSMNFRYIEINLLVSVLLLVVYRTYCRKNWMLILLQVTTVCFCIVSTAMVCVWGLGNV